MISITSATETVILQESISGTDYGEILPRISRTATLDGGAVIATSGCTHADRTLEVVSDNTPLASEDILRRMAAQASMVQLSNYEGVFTGYISRFSAKSAEVSFTFLVQEKLTQD
jgi:hypothetical protein